MKMIAALNFIVMFVLCLEAFLLKGNVTLLEKLFYDTKLKPSNFPVPSFLKVASLGRFEIVALGNRYRSALDWISFRLRIDIVPVWD